MVGEAVGLRLGRIVLTLGSCVGEKLGAVDGFGDWIAVDGDTVGASVGNKVGVLLGSVDMGGIVGDTVGNEVGTGLGISVVGNFVGIGVI